MLVARAEPGELQEFEFQENPVVYHWEILRVAQVSGQQLQIVTKVEPVPNDERHRFLSHESSTPMTVTVGKPHPSTRHLLTVLSKLLNELR